MSHMVGDARKKLTPKPPVNLPAYIALAAELERMRTERDDWKATADYYRAKASSTEMPTGDEG